MQAAINEFILARNNLRSCTVAARGFVAGKPIYNLRAAKRRTNAALMAIADWVEDTARKQYGYESTPTITD